MAARRGTAGTRSGPPDPPEHGDLLDLLVSTVQDYAIYVIDVDGNVVTWNAGAERLQGYRAEEIIGQHFSVFFPPDDVAAGKPDRELAAAVADGRFEDEGWRLRKDGTRFWADVVVTALRDHSGRLVGFGKVTRDLSERRASEEALRDSEERFRLLVSSVQDYAIFVLDRDGFVASWNIGAERLKGYAREEIVGQHFSRFYTPEDLAIGLPQHGLGQALAHGRWENEGWRVRKDGSRFWADVIITALHRPNGEHYGFAKVTRDLTDRKRSEDRLRELDRMKTELVATVAHDLLAPMNVVRGLVRLIRDGEVAPEEQAALLDRIGARVDAMVDLVDEAFDLARIEAGELAVTSEPFDVAAVAATVVEDAADDGRVISFAGPAKVVALGDARRTRQVFANVIANACKFSPSDAPVAVAIELRGDQVLVSVCDRGPGVDPADRERIFERFVRLGGSAAETGGGLGLFIARSLVEAQGGRIWVDGTDGGGATFRFTLPAAVGHRS